MTGPAPTPDAPVPPLRGAALVTGLWTAVIALLIARRPFDLDGWWHIRVGQWIVDHHAIPTRDPFSWTTARERWQLSGWLFDALLGALGTVFPLRGAAAVLMLVCFSAIGPLVFVAARRAGAAPWPACVAACMVQAGMIPWAAERPQILSYLIFLGVLALLPAALRGSWWRITLITLLFALWANLHIAFIIGVAVVSASAFGHAVVHRRWLAPACTAIAAAVAGLLNPAGVRVYTAVLKANGSTVGVDEWRHASPSDARAVLMGAILLITIVLVVRTGRWRHLETSLPLALLTVLFLMAIRNGPYALILAGPELALGLGALAASATRGARLRRFAGPARDGVIVGTSIILVLGLVSLSNPRGVDPTTIPERAVAAIPAGCRLLNEYAHGGYIIATRGPSVLTSQDTRQILSDAAIIEQAHVLDGRPGAIRWIDEHRVDCVLLAPGRPLRGTLEARGWRVVARDPSGVLLVRPDTI